MKDCEVSFILYIVIIRPIVEEKVKNIITLLLDKRGLL